MSSTGATSRRAFADIREPREGDTCPKCGGRLAFQTALEVGHIFKLGTHYSEPLGARFLDEDGTERPIVMGCYGIGPGRIMAAAVEQNHDEHGIAWPRSLAPYEVEVVAIGAAGPEAVEIAERVAGATWRRRGSRCSSTTATCARARSSPTPT